MFKRPLNDLKTSAPLRSSDRRKLRNKILSAFDLAELPAEESEVLVPDGILSAKFSTNLDEHGVVYISPDGDPLWYTLGKGEDMVPTVYTLWNRPSLLPTLSTPAPVIPVLIGGADLMIPGVVTHSPNLRAGQLVGVAQYASGKRGPPLAVGYMAVAAEGIRRGAKGKAVLVEHTYKDKLWEMGRRAEPPEALDLVVDVEGKSGGNDVDRGLDGSGDDSGEEGERATPPPGSEVGAEGEIDSETETEQKDDSKESEQIVHELSPRDVSSILRTSLIQALRTSLLNTPSSAFPITASTFYASHILPARPAFVPSPASPTIQSTTPIDIKHSSHKSLAAFLRQAEKDGLLRLKEAKGKGKASADALIVAVSSLESGGVPELSQHVLYRTVGEAEARREKREEKEAEGKGKVREIGVVKMWKPHQQSLKFFTEAKKDTSTLYDFPALKPILNEYISDKRLVNPQAQHLISLDNLLRTVFFSGKSSASAGEEQRNGYKRETLLAMLIEKMQPWHRIEVEGKDPVTRKGEAKPISVVVKLRQGRKACTLITHFEAFLLDADALADELQKLCASSTTVTPLPAKGAGSEVMVQGSQIANVTKHLMSKGVPREWIESADLIKKKK